MHAQGHVTCIGTGHINDGAQTLALSRGANWGVPSLNVTAEK